MRIASLYQFNCFNMKVRIILFLIVSFFGCNLYSQSSSKVISFEEKAYDFGKILETKGRVSHTFTFWNRSKVSVAIERIASGCGCTTYSYTKEPIRAGHKGKIIVTFDPLYRPGFFSKEITVFSNNHNCINRVWVKGFVIPFNHPVEEDYPYSWGRGLHTNLKILAFGEIAKGMSKQIKLRYANNTNKPMILNFAVGSKNENIKFTNPGMLAPMKRGQMVISYTMKKDVCDGTEIVVDIYPIVNGTKLSQPIQAKIVGAK